jgi:hypothetical protein
MVFPFKEQKREVKRIYIPVDLVQKYSSQGMSEQQIVSRLMNEGFDEARINRALQIALRETVRAPPPREEVAGPVPMGERQPFGYPPERVVPPTEAALVRYEEAPQTRMTFEKQEPEQFQVPELGEITVEEIVEGVVSEKWEEFEDRLGNFEKKDIQIQGQIDDLRKKIDEINKSMRDREQTLLSKLGEVGESMDTIQGRIGSIEKVFKDFLPELTENIKVMSEIVEKHKK